MADIHISYESETVRFGKVCEAVLAVLFAPLSTLFEAWKERASHLHLRMIRGNTGPDQSERYWILLVHVYQPIWNSIHYPQSAIEARWARADNGQAERRITWSSIVDRSCGLCKYRAMPGLSYCACIASQHAR